jgi:hypothetical protein
MYSYVKRLLTGDKEEDEKIIRKLLSGNVDVDREILFRVEDDEDLLRVCSANKYAFKEVCNDKFFQNRTVKKFPKTVPLKPKEMTWKNYYLNLLYYIDKLKREYDFDYKGERDPEEIYNILLIDNHEVGLERATQKNYTNLVKYFIDKGLVDEYEDWDTILGEATGNENKELIDIAIERGATDFDHALYEAAKVNNKELIKFFLDKGADSNRGLSGAAERKNVNLINYFLSLKNDVWSWNEIMLGASEGGHYDLAMEAIKNGDREILIFDNAMFLSAESGNLDLLKYFIEVEQTNEPVNISNAVVSVIRKNPKNAKEILNYLETKGFNNWDYALQWAKFFKRDKLIKFFLEEKM